MLYMTARTLSSLFLFTSHSSPRAKPQRPPHTRHTPPLESSAPCRVPIAPSSQRIQSLTSTLFNPTASHYTYTAKSDHFAIMFRTGARRFATSARQLAATAQTAAQMEAPNQYGIRVSKAQGVVKGLVGGKFTGTIRPGTR